MVSDDVVLARTIWNYLRVPSLLRPCDVILVFGGHDPGVAATAHRLFRAQLAPIVVVSGSDAHLPEVAAGYATEAEYLASLLTGLGIPKSAILVERLASNTSENFWFSYELLRDAKRI